MLELTPIHHRLLYSALDGDNLCTSLYSFAVGAGYDDTIELFPPLQANLAIAAALELLDAGYVEVSYYDDRTDTWRVLPLGDSGKALADPANWDPRHARQSYELTLTPAGNDAFADAHRRFGAEIDQRLEEARARSDKFLKDNPEWVVQRDQWLKNSAEWVEHGGDRPQPPQTPPSPRR